MNLFEIKNNKLIYSPEALALDVFKVLFERDKNKDKSKAIAELAAIYYMVDFKSDFQNILDDATRLKEITSVLSDLGKDWKPDAQWMDAIEFYKKLQETPSMSSVVSARKALDKIRKFMDTMDLTAVDKSGKPKYSPKQMVDTIASLPKALKELKALEEDLKKELEQKNNKLRGGRDKGAFAD